MSAHIRLHEFRDALLYCRFEAVAVVPPKFFSSGNANSINPKRFSAVDTWASAHNAAACALREDTCIYTWRIHLLSLSLSLSSLGWCDVRQLLRNARDIPRRGRRVFLFCMSSLPPPSPPPTERANCFDPCLNCPETAIAQDPTIKRHGGMRRIAHSRSNACKDTHFYYTLSIRIRVTFRREILYHESPRKVTQDCCIPLPKFRDSTIIFISRIINK